ncbi:ataxin-1 and HBP1 module (AXH) domain-containing protein [Ditylenchus destructor]|uniref:Ataxin-1 and HBP1 module (AXH) domain-containing protein n=1 Tax=Ditylenchus destructor TaxID=166010 RepID=A0AAD4N933_9BILA|nr:ataxin-1 and HBP1 module (AXH) domain-containing protein [Ditylenchus destructor]
MSGLELDPYYPTHFLRGTRLVTHEASHNQANTSTKLVETLTAQDFLSMSEALTNAQMNGSHVLSGLKISKGTVCGIKLSTCNKYVNINVVLENHGEEFSNDGQKEGNSTLCNQNSTKTSVQCPVEYPLFVTDSSDGKQGWSSYDPNKTLNLYGLESRELQVGL